MKRKLAAFGLAAMLALTAVACDTVDDPGNGGTGSDTLGDLTVPSTGAPTTMTPSTTAAG